MHQQDNMRLRDLQVFTQRSQQAQTKHHMWFSCSTVNLKQLRRETPKQKQHNDETAPEKQLAVQQQNT